MGQRLTIGICGALLVAAFAAPPAPAATVVGDYRFQNALSPSFGLGPPLTNIGPGTNSFASDSVFGPVRPVLGFPQNNGVQISPVGIPASTAFSVVATFRLASTDGYRRVFDWKNDTSDEGLYVHNGKVSLYYGGATDAPTINFTPGTWGTVVFTTNAPDLGSDAYFNGAKVATSSIGPGILGNTLRFFRDAAGGTPNEASAGAVACIRVFSGTLTANEVSQIGGSATCGGPPIPTSAEKKCKKKRPKKRSASAAKKKRKKCGKKKPKRR